MAESVTAEALNKLVAGSSEDSLAVHATESPLSLGGLVEKLNLQLQADVNKVVSLTTVAYVTERMLKRGYESMMKDREAFITALEAQFHLDELPVPKEMITGLLGMVVDQTIKACFDRVARDAGAARTEASKLEGAIQARQELLDQIKPGVEASS